MPPPVVGEMGKLNEKLACQIPPYFNLGQQEMHSLALCAQEDSHSLKTMPSFLDSILSDIASSDEEIASPALRSLAYVLHIEKFVEEISDEVSSTILSSLCQLVIATDKQVSCSLAIWCLTVQKFQPQLVEIHLPQILGALVHTIGHPKSSKSLINEALHALGKTAQRFPSCRTRSSFWAPVLYKHLLSGDKKDREIAEQCMEDLKLTLLPPELSLSKVVAVDINQTLLPKMERMIKSKALVLPTVHAWGWFVRLLGGLAGENRSLVNQLLKIVELTFTNQDHAIRIASLVAWEALIDALLQSSITSIPDNGSIQTGVNISPLSSDGHDKSPPLKRLKLLMVPLISITVNDKDQAVRLACWRTWNYLAQKLGIGINQVSVVHTVVVPIFEAMFRYGPDKGHPSAWDSCLHALEAWICSKVQDRIDSCLSQALCMDIPGKVSSPKTPTCLAPESVAETSTTILWAPWSLDLLDILLKLVEVLWNSGVKMSKSSCTSYLSLNGALRMFLLLVKGVENDGKGAVKPLKQHIDSVHLLLIFLSKISSERVSPTCSKDLLSAVWSLVESLLSLQPLVLSSSFYKLVFPSIKVQESAGQCRSISHTINDGRDEQEVLELRSCEPVTPIVYMIASWLQVGVRVDFAGPDGGSFKNKLASLVVSATSGINILGNLQGIASVLEWSFHEFCKQGTVKEDGLSLARKANKEARLSNPSKQNCICMLHSWSVFAEHTRNYLERASNVPVVEGGIGDSGYQVIFSLLLYPILICLQLAFMSCDNNSFSSLDIAKDKDEGFQLVCSTWTKLYDCASNISTRTSSQPNFFANALSQKILKLLEKQWQQYISDEKDASNESSFLAEMLAVVVTKVLKQAEVSSLATLAINRKKRLGSFMGVSGVASGARGSETDNASTVRDILLLTSRILDLSWDKFVAGQAHWVDSASRVLEELARFTACLDLQHDVLVFLQEFSKPYAKWLKATESLLCNQADRSSSSAALIQSLQNAWQIHLHSLQKCHPPLAFESSLLSLQALALVPALQHSQTSILNCTVAFWEATYGSRAAVLQYPPCLVPVLSQLKSKGEISLPGWSSGSKSSARKSDVLSYTYTGRRRLQMFQEHLVDTKQTSHSFAMFGPKMTCDEGISSQAQCPSLPQSPGDEKINPSNTPENVSIETVGRPTGFVTCASRSLDTEQTAFKTSQGHVSSSSDMIFKNGGIVQEANKESTEKGLLVTSCAELGSQGNLGSSPSTGVLVPKRKNLRFSNLKTFAYASSVASEEGKLPMTEPQSVSSLVKQGEAEKGSHVPKNQSPNSCPSVIKATRINTSSDVPNHSIEEEEKVATDSDSDAMLSNRSRLRCTKELQKLGIQRKRFLRSTGSLRGGKFWRGAGAVKAFQKIKKQATNTVKNGLDAELASVSKVKKRGRPRLVRLTAVETLAEEVKPNAVERVCGQKVYRKRGRPRRLGLVNSEALDATEAQANARDMSREVQTSCEQGAETELLKAEKLSKKASMESPFRVQTLNRGIHGKIFSSIATHSTAMNSGRSHHRKNDFPRRIPLFEDKQQEGTDLQGSCGAHLHPNVCLGKRSRETERYRGFGFTTPSKILRSGKRLKSGRLEAMLTADKFENQEANFDSTLQVSDVWGTYRSLSSSLTTACQFTNEYVGLEKEFHLFTNPSGIDRLQAANQFSHDGFRVREGLTMSFDDNSACPAGKARSHDNNSGMAAFISKRTLLTGASPTELEIDGEIASVTQKQRLCDVLADMSTSPEWDTMSLDDLDCAQKMLSKLQGVVCESKKRVLINHAKNL